MGRDENMTNGNTREGEGGRNGWRERDENMTNRESEGERERNTLFRY